MVLFKISVMRKERSRSFYLRKVFGYIIIIPIWKFYVSEYIVYVKTSKYPLMTFYTVMYFECAIK